ncbi:MAG: nucleotidyltransferase family protein [Oscillospiraceae bacterium]|nr:nucleotidyltransferase family protein [Oscillospiraceae bacterium]
MAKTVGIVAEYNPFHKGHAYQIDCLKKMGFEKIAAAMSGSCVQRGEISLLDKFFRAKTAVDCGVSLVCELPYPYSSCSAEGFARSGVHILKNLGVDAICFGSESADLDLLHRIAAFLLSDEYETSLKKHLAENTPFAAAREKAITEKFDLNRDVIAASNDILALEYIKECIRLNWDVQLIPIKRKGADYNDLTAKEGFASASGIRNAVKEYRFETACSFVPENIQKDFLKRLEQGDYFVADTAYEKAVISTLKKLSAADFEQLPDCNMELSHAFENAAAVSGSFEKLFENLPTKQYTKARLNRIILSAFLGTDKNAPALPPFIRILAMDKNGEEIVKKANAVSALPVSHSYRILQDKNADCRNIIEKEAFATDIQSLFFKFSGESRKDYTTKFYKK